MTLGPLEPGLPAIMRGRASECGRARARGDSESAWTRPTVTLW